MSQVAASDVNFSFNEKWREVFFSKARYNLIWGGRGRGGSHFGTDYFLFEMIQPDYFRGLMLRAVLGDIRDSLWRDLKDRIEASGLHESLFEINETKMSVRFRLSGNSIISKGFKKSSGKSSAKLKSVAGITHILIEETEEVDKDDFDKLDDSIRTTKTDNIQILLLFNPPSKNHWLIKRFFHLQDTEYEGYYQALPKRDPDILALHGTYLDNIQNLNRKTIRKFEGYGNPGSLFYDEEKYYIDVKGLVSEGARGRIYRGWRRVSRAFFESLPYASFYGLDFGYSTDPVALVELKMHNKRVFSKDHIYEPGLTNQDLAKLMRALKINKRSPIYADSAEEKSIEELRREGFNVIPALKGPDSVLFGIKTLKSMENYYTEDSKYTENETEEYRWMVDANKDPTDTPEDKHNHAMDARRYAVVTHKKLKVRNKVKANNGRNESDYTNLLETI